MAATRCIQEHTHGQDELLFKSSIGMMKNCDFSDFEHVMDIGLVWVFQKLLFYWDLHRQPSVSMLEVR